MPRRVYTYPLELGWGDINLFITIGALVLFLSFVIFAINLAYSARRGRAAGDSPWQAGTLECGDVLPSTELQFCTHSSGGKFPAVMDRKRHALGCDGAKS